MHCSVIGLGPAGTAAAAAARRAGHSVDCWDPDGPQYPSTMGAWEHQIPQWLRDHPRPYLSCTQPRVCGDGWETTLSDTYVILNPQALRDQLPTDDDESLHMRRRHHDPHHDDADLIVDTTPPTSGFVPVKQLAVGLVLPEGVIPTEHRHAVLMDMRTLPPIRTPDHRHEFDGVTRMNPHSSSPSHRMTFNYRMPTGEDRWLIEETIVATTCRGSKTSPESEHSQLKYLEISLRRRLVQLGIDPDTADRCAYHKEVVSFSLAPRRRQWPHSTRRSTRAGVRFPWGASAGLMHAATGYSIGMALSDANKEIEWAARWSQRPLITRNLSGIRHGPPRGWLTGWLQRRGLAATLQFQPDEMRLFYRAFFALPQPNIRSYLTASRGCDVLRAMVGVVAWLVSFHTQTTRLRQTQPETTRRYQRSLVHRTFLSLLRGSTARLPRR